MPSLILQRLALPVVPAASPGEDGLWWRGDADLTAAGLGADATVGLGTWLNAAPVGWWARYGVRAVHVTVRATGTVTVRTAGSRGVRVAAQGPARSGQPFTATLDVPGVEWAWVDVSPEGERAVTVEGVEWSVDAPGGPAAGSAPVTARPLTVVVPTFRMEDAALAQVGRLTAAALDGVVGRVVLVDQGGTLAAHPATADVLAAAGDKVLFVEQANLGGSGGYSRGLLEASERWPSDPVFLHDDDAVVHPEVLRRLQALTVLTPGTLLATGLLAAEEPASLEALAEGVERRGFRWGPTDGVADGVDVAAGTPDSWSFTRPDDPAEYAGWWGCVVPAGTVERIGLAAPYFLKWDDAEFGLRAGRAGIGVAAVPGICVWHPTWASKGTHASWSSWPLHRNRLATAAAYGAGRGVLLDSLVHQVKHVLSLQYATAELWDAALEEVLDGPGWLTADLTVVRPRAQALLDAMPTPPPVAASARTVPGAGPSDGPAPGSVPLGALRAVVGLVRPVAARDVLTLNGPHELRWERALGRDAVVFADGAPPLVRDPRRARHALGRIVVSHARAAWRWGALRRSYAEALGPASATVAWQRRFGRPPGDD